jgi:hypothetical protein
MVSLGASRGYDAWVTREPPWANWPEYTWQMQRHCQSCGCWLRLDPDRVEDLSQELECKGPDTEAYGEPVAGWIYTPCSQSVTGGTDCRKPHTYVEYAGQQLTWTCRHCSGTSESVEW